MNNGSKKQEPGTNYRFSPASVVAIRYLTDKLFWLDCAVAVAIVDGVSFTSRPKHLLDGLVLIGANPHLKNIDIKKSGYQQKHVEAIFYVESTRFDVSVEFLMEMIGNQWYVTHVSYFTDGPQLKWAELEEAKKARQMQKSLNLAKVFS